MYNERTLSDSSLMGLVTEKNDLANNSMDYSVSLMNETGSNIPVSVIITPNVTQNYVHSGQVVTYNIKITNNGTEDLNNIKLEDIIPDNAIYTYVEEKQTEIARYEEISTDAENKNIVWTMETLRPNETAECEIMLTMADVEKEHEIVNIAKLSCSQQPVIAENEPEVIEQINEPEEESVPF